MVASDRSTDLALLDVPGYSPPVVFELAQDHEVVSSQLVICHEYGTTHTEGKIIVASGATRFGNVTRRLNLTSRYDRAGDDILELSFPALRGASGAPVLSTSDPVNRLWGIIIANVSYHLLPAQIVSVLDEKNQIYEETHYLLPQALAVHVKHVRALLAGPR